MSSADIGQPRRRYRLHEAVAQVGYVIGKVLKRGLTSMMAGGQVEKQMNRINLHGNLCVKEGVYNH